MMSEELPQQLQPSDLVYVDPEEKKVLGMLQWSRRGNPKPLFVPKERGGKRKSFPFGTYRSMCNAFRLLPKEDVEARASLDEVLPTILEKLWL